MKYLLIFIFSTVAFSQNTDSFGFYAYPKYCKDTAKIVLLTKNLCSVKIAEQENLDQLRSIVLELMAELANLQKISRVMSLFYSQTDLKKFKEKVASLKEKGLLDSMIIKADSLNIEDINAKDFTAKAVQYFSINRHLGKSWVKLNRLRTPIVDDIKGELNLVLRETLSSSVVVVKELINICGHTMELSKGRNFNHLRQEDQKFYCPWKNEIVSPGDEQNVNIFLKALVDTGCENLNKLDSM